VISQHTIVCVVWHTQMTLEGSYTEPYEVGKPMYGDAIAKVLESRNSQFNEGDLVSGMLRWRKFGTLLRLSVPIGPAVSSSTSDWRMHLTTHTHTRHDTTDVLKEEEIKKSLVAKLDTKGLVTKLVSKRSMSAHALTCVCVCARPRAVQDLPLNLSLLGMTGETAYCGTHTRTRTRTRTRHGG
jgi:NADPH-dependent curcumin reductase CurA